MEEWCYFLIFASDSSYSWHICYCYTIYFPFRIKIKLTGILFKSIGLSCVSVKCICIFRILFEQILLNKDLFGSIWNGYLRGRLSTLNLYKISELSPDTTLSLITFDWINTLSTDRVIFGSFVPFDAFLTMALSNPIKSTKSPVLKTTW